MAVVKVYDINGKQKETIDLNDSIFNIEIKKGLMHEVVTAYLTNQRQGTKATKGRSQVSGSGTKPFRQKGSGRARAGHKRNPVWKGGGHAFALTPKQYKVRISKTKKIVALKSALSSKLKEEKIYVLEDFNLEKPKTQKIYDILVNLNIEKSVLLVLPEYNQNIYFSGRNIPGTEVIVCDYLNTYGVLKSDSIVILKSAVSKIEEKLK